MEHIGIKDIKEICGVNIGKYCSNLEYDRDKIIDEVQELGLSLENIIKSNSDKLDSLNLNGNFEGSMGNELIITLEFVVGGKEVTSRYKVVGRSFEEFAEGLEGVVYLGVNGIYAVNELNRLIAIKQREISAPISVRYIWGLEDRCSIQYWDYDKLKIRLNKNSIIQLISLENKESIVDIMGLDREIYRYVREFNSNALHKEIDAIISDNKLVDTLTFNMLSLGDIVEYVSKSKGVGKVGLKYVEVIDTLGLLVAVGTVKINFDNRAVDISIDSGKVLDLESGRYIYDVNIVGRIEKKLNISKYIVDIISNGG